MTLDYLELASSNPELLINQLLHLGFKKAGERYIEERKLRSHLFSQNEIKLVVSNSEEPTDRIARYHDKHGTGVCTVGILCPDATSAFESAINSGADAAASPRMMQKDFGKIEHASIIGPSDIWVTFLTRTGTLFEEGYEEGFRPTISEKGLKRFDHIGLCMSAKDKQEWDALLSHLKLETPLFVLNEIVPTAPSPEEFIEIHHGTGIQHIGFSTDNIVETLQGFGERRGVVVPHCYYEEIPNRIPRLTGAGSLERFSILADGNASGYLLHHFSPLDQTAILIEVVQRENYLGYGEGQHETLRVAMENEKASKGILN